MPDEPITPEAETVAGSRVLIHHLAKFAAAGPAMTFCAHDVTRWNKAGETIFTFHQAPFLVTYLAQ